MITSTYNFSTPKDSYFFDLVINWGRKNLGSAVPSLFFCFVLVWFSLPLDLSPAESYNSRTLNLQDYTLLWALQDLLLYCSSWQKARWMELSGLMINFCLRGSCQIPIPSQKPTMSFKNLDELSSSLQSLNVWQVCFSILYWNQASVPKQGSYGTLDSPWKCSLSVEFSSLRLSWFHGFLLALFFVCFWSRILLFPDFSYS